jgi:hypothetical protein
LSESKKINILNKSRVIVISIVLISLVGIWLFNGRKPIFAKPPLATIEKSVRLDIIEPVSLSRTEAYIRQMHCVQVNEVKINLLVVKAGNTEELWIYNQERSYAGSVNRSSTCLFVLLFKPSPKEKETLPLVSVGFGLEEEKTKFSSIYDDAAYAPGSVGRDGNINLLPSLRGTKAWTTWRTTEAPEMSIPAGKPVVMFTRMFISRSDLENFHVLYISTSSLEEVINASKKQQELMFLVATLEWS